ncbi:MAG: hypothetical protein R3F54_23025 [Alphaproteobacteria bacterium]
MDDCAHLDTIATVTPSARGCEDCLKAGSVWVHLRLCRSCGHVGPQDGPIPSGKAVSYSNADIPNDWCFITTCRNGASRGYQLPFDGAYNSTFYHEHLAAEHIIMRHNRASRRLTQGRGSRFGH